MSDIQRDPAWLAGYRAAMTVDRGFPLQAIITPPQYDARQRGEFIAGFSIGARDHHNARLMDELVETFGDIE